MEFQDISLQKNPLNIEGIPETAWNIPQDFAVGKEKIESLKKVIAEIKELIESREELSRNIYNEGERLKTEITNYILEEDTLNSGDPEDTREKNDLRTKKVEVSELQLNEKVSCWKDVALLKKELREYEKELAEKEARMKMFEGIMEEGR